MWFPEKNDPELERLASLIFDLRREVFMLTEYSGPPPGQWEDERHEKTREESNADKVREFDLETLRIVRGR